MSFLQCSSLCRTKILEVPYKGNNISIWSQERNSQNQAPESKEWYQSSSQKDPEMPLLCPFFHRHQDNRMWTVMYNRLYKALSLKWPSTRILGYSWVLSMWTHPKALMAVARIEGESCSPKRQTTTCFLCRKGLALTWASVYSQKWQEWWES